MPRRRNYNLPGHAHELTFSCYQRLPLLQADRTCQWLAESINAARLQHAFDLWAYVFMPEHVHLLIRPREDDYDIASIRRSIKGPVGRQALAWLGENNPEWIPRLTRDRGQRTERLFWQSGGGYDRNVTEPATLESIIVDYIHANPVRSGLVERPTEWRWSSAAQFDGATDATLSVDSIPPEWLTKTPRWGGWGRSAAKPPAFSKRMVAR